jgi:hypothetical protein
MYVFVVAPDNPINKVLSDVFVVPRRALALRYLLCCTNRVFV